MTTFLIILASIFGYAFMGGVIAGRHHALEARKCNSNGCFQEGYWCDHCHVTVWLFGVLWVFALPAAAGVLLGSTDQVTRTERRHARELEEAKHKAELARLAREEDEDLDRRLRALEKGRTR